MIHRLAWLSVVFFLSVSDALAQQPVNIEALVSRHTHAFEIHADGELSGPGALLLRERTAQAQFVLFGEGHHDRDTPRLAGGIYRMLHDVHGYRTVVVEQDPLAVESIMRAPLRGDAERIASLAKRYPLHLSFASDPDLEFLALASGLGTVWGVDQAQGAVRYLEELVELAPGAQHKAEAEALLTAARAESRLNPGAFMRDEQATLARLEALAKGFGAAPGTRAQRLLDGLIESARIYAFERRANAGEYVGLYYSTEREALFKRQFVREYRAAMSDGEPLKAMFKFGTWHMYRGKSPGQAYTIGSFAHEFAVWNGMQAYGINVVAVGGHTAWTELPAWMRPLLPVAAPSTPVLIDLQPLKPYVRPLRELVNESEQWQMRDLLQGFDALVLLPSSAKADWNRTGFTSPP